MTLCIAAIANQGDAICILSDKRLSLGFTSGEFFTKASKINQRWGVLLAGTNVACATPVIESAKTVALGVTSPSRSLIESAFIAAVHEQLVKRIESSVLSPYKLTMNEFTRSGLKDLGPEAFADMRQQIEHVELGCEFLVFGFDERQRPHIFHVKERGVLDDHSRTGFWAIGSGDYTAISALVFHDYSRLMDVVEATYLVCAAKFMAERADLGQQTEVGYMTTDGSVYVLDARRVREIWEVDGKPRMPVDLTNKMPQFSLLHGPRRRRAPATRKASKHSRI